MFCIAALMIGGRAAQAQTVSTETKSGSTSTTSSSPSLFTTVIGKSDPQRLTNAAIVRSRVVRLSADYLPKADATEEDLVPLNFFTTATFVGSPTHTTLRTADSYTVSGTITGYENSSFVIAVENGVVVADVHVPGRNLFQVRVLEDGSQVVREIDESKLRPCGQGPEHVLAPAGESALQGTARTRSLPQVDVMVVYTQQARALAGGTNAIHAMVNQFMAGSNNYLTNSVVATNLNLVYTGEVAYTESGNANTDLIRLTNASDGFMDAVHGLRNTYGADLVCLLVSDFNACGIGWVSSSQSTAFSVVDLDCGAPTFAHELGHNFGCAHDRANAGVPGRYPYSYGHRFNGVTGALWRTIMSYTPGTRIGYFSNPNVFFDGVPTGIPDGFANSADNARTLNTASPIIEGFRLATNVQDCNGNYVSDETDLTNGTSADCNANGVPDECDIAGGDSADSDQDGVPDECECDDAACDDGILCTIDRCNPVTGGCENVAGEIVFGDVNTDGVLDLDDITCALEGFNHPSACPPADVSPCGGNGHIDLDDIVALLDAFAGNPACPSPCP